MPLTREEVRETSSRVSLVPDCFLMFLCPSLLLYQQEEKRRLDNGQEESRRKNDGGQEESRTEARRQGKSEEPAGRKANHEYLDPGSILTSGAGSRFRNDDSPRRRTVFSSYLDGAAAV